MPTFDATDEKNLLKTLWEKGENAGDHFSFIGRKTL